MSDAPVAEATEHSASTQAPGSGSGTLLWLRCVVGGALMGLANLVPGVSGGTMILVVGLYERFVHALADATRLRFTRSSLTTLGLIGVAAAVAIVALAGTFGTLVADHPGEMFSLFIGMTLGGAPLLLKMIGRVRSSTAVGVLIGIGLMVLVAATAQEKPSDEALAASETPLTSAPLRDGLGGVLGIAAMVLPGISGAYMLLVIGRYESILGAIDLARNLAAGREAVGEWGDALGILIPVAVGALLGLVVVSNALKWLLRRHEHLTLSVLLGIVLGSVVGLWPFDADSGGREFLILPALAALGFGITAAMSLVKR